MVLEGLEPVFMAYGTLSIILCWSHMFFRHNPAFKLAEAVGVGATMGNFIVLTTRSLSNNAVYPLLEGKFINILPIVFGLLVLTQLSRSHMWMARIGIAIILGVGVGTNAYGTIGSDIMGSLIATVKMPLWITGDIVGSLSNILVIGMFLGTIAYFVFGREQRGAYGYLTRLGRWGMMICFGVAFGSILWYRETLTETGVVWVLEYFGLL
jgi:hypothetical protein